jgi:hypothetical protein
MSVPTGWWVSRARSALTVDVTGWISAKARTGPGMVSAAYPNEATHLITPESGRLVDRTPPVIGRRLVSASLVRSVNAGITPRKYGTTAIC